MAHFVIEFRERTRKKWRLVERVTTKEVAEKNKIEYSKHIRKQDEMDGMAYRILKLKGNIDAHETL